MANGTDDSTGQSSALADWIVANVNAFAAPLLEASLTPAGAASLLQNIGWQLDAVPGLPALVAQVCADVQTALAALAAAADDAASGEVTASPLSLVQHLIGAVQGVSTAIAGLSQAQAGQPTLPGLGQIVQDLLAWLTDSYLLSTHPLLHGIAVLCQLLTPQSAAPEQPALLNASGKLVRTAYQLPALHLDRLGALLANPASYLRSAYLASGTLLTTTDVDALSDALFPLVADALTAFGLGARYGLDPYFDQVQLDPATVPFIQHALTLWLLDTSGPDASRLGATFALVGPDETGGQVGAVIAPIFPASIGGSLAGWTFQAQLTAPGAPLSVVGWTPSPADLANWPGLGLTLTFSLGGAADGQATPPAPAPPGAQLVIQLSAGEKFAASLSLTAQASLSLDPGDFADGFLQQVLPDGGVVLPLSLTITGSASGWALTGSVPKGKTVVLAQFPSGSIGPLAVSAPRFQVTTEPTGFTAGGYFTASLAIGPVTATVADFGLGIGVQWPAGGGNAGLLDLAPQVLWPDGVGLGIDAGPVSGGGFVSRDPASGRYTGALELRVESLALKAIGLLDTRLPDGSAGYSLIVIITAEFEAIQLGFGFTLTGVGGLAGINRSVVVDALRAGVRAHSLNNILFPANPIANAGQILSAMATIFPPDPGSYVFGPMVRLGWGTGGLLTLELGLLLELPPPLRLIVLGRISLNLPDPGAPLVKVQMDSLGVVDFGLGQVAIDAVLFDSNIAGFALTGAMALRASWLGQPSFALSIGGFNPAFTPPAQFPAVPRVTIALCAGNNPRIRLSAYLALTSNTAQIGARLDLFVQGPLGITLDGELSFDALFQFSPFQFVVSVGGSVTIKSNGQPVLSASISVTLTGPDGWHVQGQASFQLFCISITVSFDTTIGSAQPLPAPAPVQLAQLLEAALTDPANWAAALSGDASTLLTFSAASAPGKAPAHPLASLAVHQRVLPLDISIQRYGSATPADPGSYTISSVTVGAAKAAALSPIDDWFAPGHFLRLSDADSLQRPSFEQLHAGVTVATPAFVHDAAAPPAIGAGYLTMVYDTLGGPAREVVLPGPASAQAPAAAGQATASEAAAGEAAASRPAGPVPVPAPRAAMATAPAASRGRARFSAQALPLQVIGPKYTLASIGTLAAVGAMPPAGAPGSWTAVAQNRAKYLAANPGQAGQIQIVTQSEAH